VESVKRFLTIGAAIACVLHGAAQTPAPPDLDVLLTGGTVVDGTGAPWYRADVGITGDRIARIGRLSDASARTRIDATGLVVAPASSTCSANRNSTCWWTTGRRASCCRASRPS
jgi:N-acyl-D-aspartate/D-glutamate deacylase